MEMFKGEMNLLRDDRFNFHVERESYSFIDH